MSDAIVTLIVLAVVAVLFITELLPLAVTSMLGSIALGALGVIKPAQVFSGLSNSTVVLFAGMFVIGGAMFRTGLAQTIGVAIVKKLGSGENSLMFGSMSMGGLLSSVSSNTGSTAALMPVVIGICAVTKNPPSRQLMPLAFAAGLGGTITLVGTPPNIIAAGALKAGGLVPFSFFEFAWIGIPLTVAGIAYMMLIGKRFLPKVEARLDAMDEEAVLEATASTHDPLKMWITGLTLLAVVVVMALDLKNFPLEMAAVTGALFLVVTKCITEKEAYQSVDWVTIFLFAGMMPIAGALDTTGAGKMIADQVVSVMGGNPSPIFITFVLFLLSCGLTQFMSNTASAALLCPIGISIAKGIGANPQAVIMAICIAASCAFMTPVGTPPNTLVLGPGNYRFKDYFLPGLGLVLVSMALCLLIIPVIWPF
ncbi:MAG: SLC13 family permease [Betaproteobacteria bacterium]|nr:SLC13 family permease [Betaproteobacteria bacterium]